MDYVFVVMYSDIADGGNIAEPIVAYQYEQDAIDYIEHERQVNIVVANHLYIERLIFRY